MAKKVITGSRAEAAAAVGLRLDKWLWHARFYKTRALATAAVGAGHVRLNGERVKASRAVRVDDRIAINASGRLVEVDVRALPVRRGPAIEARGAYEETPESVLRGVAYATNQRLGAFAAPRPLGRPDKKARRQLMALGRRQGEDSRVPGGEDLLADGFEIIGPDGLDDPDGHDEGGYPGGPEDHDDDDDVDDGDDADANPDRQPWR